jgi:DNA-3-methyladenine glycosylase
MEILWGDAGYAYVYCMHTHWLLNVTTQQNGVPECVLVRALFPLSGIETMVARRGGRPQRELMSGPGRLTQAMGIDKRHLGIDLLCPSSPLRLERAHDDEVRRAGIDEASQIERGPRIGIGYAGNDATLPLRFRLR